MPSPHQPSRAAVLVTDQADNTHVLTAVRPQENESGWDSARFTYLVRKSSAGSDPMAALAGNTALARGAAIPGMNMWIVARTPVCICPGFFEVEVSTLGLLSPRGMKVRYGSAATQQSGVNVTSPAGLHPKVSVREAAVTTTLEYIAIGINIDGLTVKTGRAHNPPSVWQPAVPSSVWNSLADPTYHFPNGWVFEGVEAENLPGLTNVFLIRENYQHQYAFTP